MPALIFDYDGLLADTEELAASVLVDLLADRGVTTGFESMVELHGIDRSRQRRGVGSAGCTNGSVPTRIHVAFEAAAWELIEARRHEVPIATPACWTCSTPRHGTGWQVAIGTGQARARLDTTSAHLGLLDRFDEIVTAADVARGKPAPDIFLEVARRLGVDPVGVRGTRGFAPGLRGRAARRACRL